MTAAQLRLLLVFAFQLLSDAVEQLYVALVWILLQAGNESPRHGSRSLTSDIRVGSVPQISVLRHAHNFGKSTRV